MSSCSDRVVIGLFRWQLGEFGERNLTAPLDVPDDQQTFGRQCVSSIINGDR